MVRTMYGAGKLQRTPEEVERCLGSRPGTREDELSGVQSGFGLADSVP